MYAKVTKMAGLQRLLLYALKACFTQAELGIIAQNGITIQSILDKDNWNSVSKGAAQKGALTLMCRWPMDDIDDLKICLLRQTAEVLVTRASLGMAGSDGVLETLAERLQGLIDEVGPLYAGLANTKKLQLMNRRDSTIISDPNGDMIEYCDPEFTFDDENVITTFLQIMTVDRSGRWDQI